MILMGSTGMVATTLPLDGRCPRRQLLAPCAALRQTEQRAAAARAHLLIVVRSLRGIHLVAEPEIPLDRDQIRHHHRRRVRTPATPAPRLLPSRAGVLVEADADLR